MKIALKVDVDTHRGLGEGVPRLKRALEELGVTASFYVAMGPDNAGRAIVRILRNRGFLAKMRRTGGVSMYGLRTILSGTLLPARAIALAFPEIVRGLAGAGFEVGIHGHDHVRWQDRIDELGAAGIRSEIENACETYRAILGTSSTSFAAPGWRTNDTAELMLEEKGFAYRSNTRGCFPYRCRIGDQVLGTPEIPTTLPTLDEIIGGPALARAGSIEKFYLEQMRAEQLNVHTIHAETEGLSQLEPFCGLVRALRDRGAEFVRLGDVAAGLSQAELPVFAIVRRNLPGRAGWISAQES